MPKDDDKKNNADIFRDYIQGRMSEGSKKWAGSTKKVILTWVICLAVVFVVVPLMIGMISSGYVDFGNGLAIGLGIANAVLIIIVAGFM